MSEIYYRNKNEKGKIDKNLVNANIKLVDENKYIKEQIKKIINDIEEQPFELGYYDDKNKVFYKLDLLNELRSLVE
jgi:hypothetical protein